MTRDEAVKGFNAGRLALMDRIRRDKRLTSSSRLVGAELCNRLDFETGDAYPSQDYLVEKLGLVERTVKTAVKALSELGYFKIVKRGWANRYEPNFDVANQVQKLPPIETDQVQNLPLTDNIRGKKVPHQVQKTSEIRGKKGPPTSLENSLTTSDRPPAGGAPLTGAACERFMAIAGDALRVSLGEAVFKSWLSRLRFVREGEDALVLSAPNKLFADRVKRDFSRQILFAAGYSDRARLEIVVSETAEAVGRSENPDARWLLDFGIDLVAEQRGISRKHADAGLKDYLSRGGNDPTRLREILNAAAGQGLRGEAFDRRVKELARGERGQQELRLLRVVEPRRA